jgi:hypothetical protein
MFKSSAKVAFADGKPAEKNIPEDVFAVLLSLPF